MDKEFPINRIAGYFGPLFGDKYVHALLSEFTDTAIAFTEEAELSPDDEPFSLEKVMSRLVFLMLQEATHDGATQIILEPRRDGVAVLFKFKDGRVVERDSLPKRIHPDILRRLRQLFSDGSEFRLEGQPACDVAFHETEFGQAAVLTIRYRCED
jgi:hypothetical protein